MKLILSILISLLAFSFQAEAQNSKSKKTKHKKATPVIQTTSVRGAASVDELGKLVFDALQNNRFESISHYFPTETDLKNTENRTSDEDLQVVLEDHSTADIETAFRTDFESLQNKSIEQKLNFSELNLMEVQAGTPAKANRLVPVNLLLTNTSNETMALAFEAIKINGRFFLFQHIKVKQ